MRYLTGDSKGIEGLPLKILIVALVLGISIPSVLAIWTNAEVQRIENSLRSELDYLNLRIVQIYRSGPGNAISFKLEIDSGMVSSIEYVLVGDNLDGPLRSTLRWKISGRSEAIIAIEDDVPVCSKEGGAFPLSEGYHTIYLVAKKREDGLVFVEISTLD